MRLMRPRRPAPEISADDLAAWADELQPKVTVFVMASGMGRAGKQLARSAAGQFPEAKVFVHPVPHIRDDAKVEEALRLARSHRPCIIVYSVCMPDIKEKVSKLAELYNIPCVDPLGPLFDAVTRLAEAGPLEFPLAYNKTEQDHAILSAAMRFAIAHDDGARDEDWDKADILLMGVSRAGKSPLSMFLASLGYKVANYPVCPGVPLPVEALGRIDRRRVFGLTMEPSVLVQHRQCRAASIATGQRSSECLASYTSLKQVYEEVETVEKMYKDMRITLLDCTDTPMPALASKIIHMLFVRFNEDDSGEGSPKELRRSSCNSRPLPIGALESPWGYGGDFEERRVTLCLATTGAGFCGSQVLNAVGHQFPGIHVSIQVIPHVHDLAKEEFLQIVQGLEDVVVVFTVVISTLREELVQLMTANNIPNVDLLGPLNAILQQELEMKPIERPGVYTPKDAEYFRSIEAVEFAMRHDSGALMGDWPHADCILLGAPMTGKSAVSVYLGSMGWAVANYTVDPEGGLPEELKKVDSRRVIGLVCNQTISPDLVKKKARQVEAIRNGGMKRLEDLFRSHGITVIDVTAMPTESIASRVVRQLDEAFPNRLVGLTRPSPGNSPHLPW
eukprot:EG_transcript_3162